MLEPGSHLWKLATVSQVQAAIVPGGQGGVLRQLARFKYTEQINEYIKVLASPKLTVSIFFCVCVTNVSGVLWDFLIPFIGSS